MPSREGLKRPHSDLPGPYKNSRTPPTAIGAAPSREQAPSSKRASTAVDIRSKAYGSHCLLPLALYHTSRSSSWPMPISWIAGLPQRAVEVAVAPPVEAQSMLLCQAQDGTARVGVIRALYEAASMLHHSAPLPAHCRAQARKLGRTLAVREGTSVLPILLCKYTTNPLLPQTPYAGHITT